MCFDHVIDGINVYSCWIGEPLFFFCSEWDDGLVGGKKRGSMDLANAY